MDDLNFWLVGGGLFIGATFGVVVQRTQFCMVAAVSNAILIRDFRHAHGYFVALAVALLGTLFLEASGLVAISETAYRVPRYDWMIIVIGGLIFGFGSVLAGGCAGRTTVRAAEGNLGALIALLAFALTAAATYFGALEPYRVWLMQHATVDLKVGDSSISAVLGLPGWVGPALIVLALLAGIFLLGRFRESSRLAVAGAITGLLVIVGWLVTGYLSQDDFTAHRASSITVAGPLARATVYFTTGGVSGDGFSVSVLLGIVVGALSSAVITRSFHLTIPEPAHLKHLLVGGAMMGIGAICAGGCNIGVGLTGMSTASVRALTALVSIVVGMLLGIGLLTSTERVVKEDGGEHAGLAGA